jgi:ABC-type transport system involved in multi-copper enzyme maturation permease subunit
VPPPIHNYHIGVAVSSIRWQNEAGAVLGPIFNRELLTIPRRSRHYLTRSFYLFALWALTLTTWQATLGWGRRVSLKDLADFGLLAFQTLSVLQLTLALFFAALSAASSITQEKDRRTFVLLLMTDLRNHEIVLGKLFGSLLHIFTLVVSAVPLMALIMLLGGVSMQQILLSLLVLLCSALAAGSLGALLALWREKTFQTLALTVLALVLYFLVVEGLGLLPAVFGSGMEAPADYLRERLNPFRALASVIAPPTEASLVASPAYEFAALMVLFAAVLNGIGLWKLRVWNPSGEPIQQPEAPPEDVEAEAGVDRRNVHAAPGRARPVWPNPILWREMRTRAYGRRSMLVKLLFLMIVGLIAYWAYQTLPPTGPGSGHRLLPAYGLVPTIVLSLLLLNAQAVTAITSERDLRSLDLLLATDLSPREFIFGKLGGVFYNSKEIVLPPFLMVFAYAYGGYIGGETLLYLVVALVVLMIFTAVLGLHIALHTVNTRLAIGYSLGTVFFLFIGTFVCIYLLLISGRFETQWTSFILFLAIGIGGLWLVLSGNKPSVALSISAWVCPLGVFYALTNSLVEKDTGQPGDPLTSFLVIGSAFGFTVAAMLVPLLSEFEVAMGYSAPAEE